jgi:hypothetical protein
MLCTLVSVESESELLDATQSLKFRRVDQTHHQLACVGVGAKANDVMDRIAIDSFGHLGDFLVPAKGAKGNETREELHENPEITRGASSTLSPVVIYGLFPIFWIFWASERLEGHR